MPKHAIHSRTRRPRSAPIRRRSAPATPSICPASSDSIPPTGNLVEGIEAQAHQVFRNLRAVAQAAGGELDDIVKLTMLLADLADFAKVNEIMATLLQAAVSGARDLPGGGAAQGRADRGRRHRCVLSHLRGEATAGRQVRTRDVTEVAKASAAARVG